MSMHNAPEPLRVMTILGTRPEIIKLSRVMPALDRYTRHTCVHTGQNYDRSLNDIFFDELELRRPDVVLPTVTTSLGSMLGTLLIEIEKVLDEYRPEAVLILGDTNSSLAALMVKRKHIPVYHMEAGNRCFDDNVPEEINRRIVDCVADFNLVYTEHARRHLLSEGHVHRSIYLTGSPMKEVLDHYRDRIEASGVLSELGLTERGFILASFHREDNVDREADLLGLLETLTVVGAHFQLPIVVSTHPRTRDRLASLPRDDFPGRILFAEPFGFFDYNKLQLSAFCVLSDSGTITEESALLGVPAVTVRRSMERPEGLDAGCIVLTGLDPAVVCQAVAMVSSEHASGKRVYVPGEYEIANVAERVVKLILGTARLWAEWEGIRPS